MFERVRHMLIKEFKQVLRDPRMRGVVFVMPVVQLLVFGYAVSMDVRHVPTGVFDQDHSVASREVIQRFLASGYFTATEFIGDDARACELLDRAAVSAVLRLPPGFGADLEAGRTAPLQLIVDGTDSNTARIVLDYANRIINQFNADALSTRLAQQAGVFRQPGPIELQTRAWFNENLESRNYYVPGVIAIIVALITLLLTGMAVVREKEMGTIEQILVTPITPFEFILGKTVPFALIAFVDMVLVTSVGVHWFGVPIRGNPFLLLLAALLYLLTMLGVGLLISTVSRTQQQAMMSTFFFHMPVMLLSGFMFPIANMPPSVQWLTCLNPQRYFLVILRGIFLKGVGLLVLWPSLLALAAIGVLTLGLAVRRFRKTLA